MTIPCIPMSNDRLDEFESRLNILDKIVKLGWALIFGAFALGAWATLLEIRTQATQRDVDIMKSESSDFVAWRAEANGNRYTSTDHMKYASDVSTSLNGHDKRLTRLEDSILATQKALDRIENKLQTAPR